jgi:hypothetical protein
MKRKRVPKVLEKHQEKDHKDDGKYRSGKMSQRRKDKEEREQQWLQEDETKTETEGLIARWATQSGNAEGTECSSSCHVTVW